MGQFLGLNVLGPSKGKNNLEILTSTSKSPLLGFCKLSGASPGQFLPRPHFSSLTLWYPQNAISSKSIPSGQFLKGFPPLWLMYLETLPSTWTATLYVGGPVLLPLFCAGRLANLLLRRITCYKDDSQAGSHQLEVHTNATPVQNNIILIFISVASTKCEQEA